MWGFLGRGRVGPLKLVRTFHIEKTHLFDDSTVIYWILHEDGSVNLTRVEHYSEQHDRMFTLCLTSLQMDRREYFNELSEYAYQAAYPHSDESGFAYPLSKVIS